MRSLCFVAVLCFSLSTLLPAQGTGGRILGRVADPTAAVLSGVKVTATNDATGVNYDTQSNDSGDYGFPNLPVGTYTLTFDLTGFKKAVRHSIALDVNQVITLNMTMQLGAAQEVVDVTSEAPLVDTSSTQLGAVVNNRSVNELPLNARDSYQFLQLQPGVQSQLGSSGGTFYGSDSAGSVSVNGGRDRANNFSVNGGDANDQFVNLPAIQPTPDAIEEFRVISNTFDAEYGRNSGAVVNVVTKSGTNQWHGNVYEYFRNKVLNAQGYFNTVKPQFNQNQFGGTFGGPLKKDRTFFFTSYEGRRVRQGISGQTVIVPTPQERPTAAQGGSVFAGGFPQCWPGTGPGTGNPCTPNQINDQTVADALNGRPGCTAAITTAGGLTPAAGVPWGGLSGTAIFPTDINGNATIPTPCMDPVAMDMLRFVPGANRPDGISYQAVPTSFDNQDQFTLRFDHHINDHQSFSFYYYYNDGDSLQPFYNFQASGANIPGFGAKVASRYQQFNPSHTWTISNSLVNEARFTYMREGQLTFQHPQSTGSVQASCTSAIPAGECFGGTSDSSAVNALISTAVSNGTITDASKAGITTGLPFNHTGVPFVSVAGGFAVGNGWEGELPQVGNSFMWADNLTWVKGSHTMKFGADVRRDRFDQTLFYNVSGQFTFNSSTSNSVQYGDNYPGYLLGLVDNYVQGSAQRENVRSTGVYLFAQDSWKIKPSLTLNYGLRWELDTPLTDVLRHVQTFRPGQNSTVYPCMLTTTEQSNFGVTSCADAGVEPTGLVVPGDPGVPAGMTQTYYKAFAPRIGVAYSPSFTNGALGKLFGANGKTSIRSGWGLFYNPMEQLVLEQFGAEPPFGGSTLLQSTFFNTPFVAQNGSINPNPFIGMLEPKPGTAQDWSSFRPMLLYGDFQPHMRTQYTAQYNFTVQRELAKDIVLQLGYVGSQGHRLLASHDINPANPQTCLDIAALAANDPTKVLSYGLQASCGPFGEDNQFSVTLPATNGSLLPSGFHLPTGGTVQAAGQTLNLVGLRPHSSPNCNPALPAFTAGTGCPIDGVPVFSNIFAEDTIAASAYNSFQASLEKRFSHGLQLQAAYTFSKSLDWASSFEETVNPFNYKASRALSLFNSKQRFVINYVWDIPARKYSGFAGKVLDEWQLSGIIQLQSGFPIRIQTQDDNELISSLFFLGAGAPQLTGPLQILNPKTNGGQYLNPAQFSDPTLGTFATTPRSICCGPGENQWDITVSKRIALSESKYFQFRADIFNLFNKTQFVNPDGNFSDTTFGLIQQARDPRLVQFALKLYF
ncbi:MAG TPA: TonB-dependent receptor [Candidatus Sulfotelmatobacter sp.]|nr:TonB-dependent receptor [Candidatus Sulfotelmatobacter sp.]